MSISKEFVESVRNRIAEDPAVSTYRLAEDLGASESQVITALPVKMRQKARPEDFRAIWQAVEGWHNVRLRGGEDANGQSGQLADLVTPGIPEEELGYIWFVSKPEPETESHSVQFYSKAGQHMLSVYLGQAGQEGVDPRDKAAYDQMREHFGVTPVPRRCQGCGSCTCGGKHKSHAHSH